MTAERPNEAAASADFEFAALREATHYRAALLREFAPHLRGRVLEVGAGIGQLTAQLRQWPGIETLAAVEPEPSFCRAFHAALPEVRLIEGTIERVPPDPPWHAILSVNVLEHIRDDAAELAAYHRRLAPSRGRLCLFVPARPEIYAPIDKQFGHHRRYTRLELARKLSQAGFGSVRLHYFNFAGYFGWWLNFRVRKKLHFEAQAVRLFDKAIFPMMHWLESRVCRPPIGQSLLAVAGAAK
jgi:SAM-dependent methyltransferase